MDACVRERLERRRHRSGRGQRDDHGPPRRAILSVAGRRDVREHAARLDTGTRQRYQRLAPHRFVRAVGHDHLAVIARHAPHDDRSRTFPQRLELRRRLGSCRRQHVE
jgi:hypothetical protein